MARPSVPMVAVLALAAVLVGAAAVLLVGTSGSQPSGAGGGSGGGASGATQLTIDLPLFVWGLILLSPLIVFFALLIYRRITEGGRSQWSALLVLVIVGLLMLWLLYHGGGGNGNGLVGFGVQSGNNESGSNLSNNTTSNGSGGGGSGANGTTATPLTFSVPPYVYWLAAIGLTVVVAALALPGVASRLLRGRDRSGGGGAGGQGDRDAVASAMDQAASALEQGADPRETIVRLYLDLLRTMSPITGELSFETAEEIRRLHLGPLGVPPDVAEALTRLFEEARYSTHPLDASSVSRATEAIRRAEAALRGRGAAA